MAHLSTALALFDADPDGPGKDLFASCVFKAVTDPDAVVRSTAGSATCVLFRRFRPEKHSAIFKTVLARLPPVVEGVGSDESGEGENNLATQSEQAYAKLSAKFTENERRYLG